jgi:uncharacterized protein YcbX
MREIGRVGELWRYPVKSLQGFTEPALRVTPQGVVGDRRWAVIDEASGHVLSAKRAGALLFGRADDESITLPDGTVVRPGQDGVDEVLSAWLGRRVRLAESTDSEGLSYEMTFDPPNDDAEYYEIPIPAGTFVDLADVHLVTTATLRGCAEGRPDIGWDVRRFRPNVVVEADGPTFMEDSWVGGVLRLGEVELRVDQPTVRCAMPLRAQPPAGDDQPELDRQPGLFRALEELNVAHPNHLGVYAEVVGPGTVAVGDPVSIELPDPVG